jgi:hypothetical protein
MPLLRQSLRGWAAVVSLLLTLVAPSLTLAAADFIATIPKEALDALANSALVEVRAVGGPGGPLHPAGPTSSNDCEFHFVITPADAKWTTSPKPWVAEPPNVCLYDRDGAPPDIDDLRDRWKALKPKWKSYAEMLKDKDVVVEGVPRLWFEHMGEDGPPSSPGHALEIHPVTKITLGASTTDFTSFLHDIPNNPGISENTIFNTLKRSKVTIEAVTAAAVRVGFEKHSNLGNFARVRVRVDLASLKPVAGGHRANATTRANGETFRVSVLSVVGTATHRRIQKAKDDGQATTTISVLALFSLSPAAIKAAAANGPGTVTQPFQFILFGLKGDFGHSNAEDEGDD